VEGGHGTSGRRRLAGSRPRHRGRGRHVRAHQQHLPQLGHAGRRARTFRDRRFPAARGRYHLYVALSCPWAHRTLIFRALKKLDGVISLSVVSPQMKSGSWDFAEFPGVIADSVNHKQTMPEVYLAADSRFTGRVTVPVLWDKERATIVNNESSEIIRMFNAAFDAFTDVATDYYPAALRRRSTRSTPSSTPT
jgi:glutathionyl-hydroquinone reductase